MLFLLVEHNMQDACALALPAWYNPFSSSDSCTRYHTLVLTGNSSYISGNISSSLLVQRTLLWQRVFLESPPARLKNVVCGFQTISCLLSFKEGKEWISSAACLFSTLRKRTSVHKCINPKHFQVSGIKISNVVTKETSQILLQTLWHLQKPQINLVSLWGDSFTNVGYNIGQVKRFLSCINRCHRLFWTGLLLTPTMAT